MVNLIFLLAFASLPVVYFLYFYFLNDFKNALSRDHKELIVGRRIPLITAYTLLHRVKAGRLQDTELSTDASVAHGRAKRFLYLGISLFMVFLFILLAESLFGGMVGAV